MFKSIKTRIPKEEQRTVRIAVIGIGSNQIPNFWCGFRLKMLVDTIKSFLFESLKGRESSGKSSLINALLGRKACPVASVPGSTANARIHTMTLGNTLFEFCDVPGRGLSLIIYQNLYR